MKILPQNWISILFLITIIAFAVSCGDDDDDDDSGSGLDDDDDTVDDDDTTDDDDTADDDDTGDDDDSGDDDDDDDDDVVFNCDDGLEIHGTNVFDDEIRLCILDDEKEGSHTLKGEWDFLTGLENNDDWYDTFTVSVWDDFSMTETADEGIFEFSNSSFEGEFYEAFEDVPNSLIMSLDGDYDGHTGLYDVFYAAEMPEECQDNYPPFMFYEELYVLDCETWEILSVEEDFTIETGQCFGLLWAISNPGCNWEGGNLFEYDDGDEEWDPVWEEPFTDEDQPPCSYFSTEGTIWGRAFYSVGSPTTLTYYHRITDSCGVASPIVESTIEVVDPAK